MFSFRWLLGHKSKRSDNIKKLDPKAFNDGIQNPHVQLLDVRTPNEYQQGHIKNAKLIDFYANDFKAQLLSLDKDKPIYLYCRSGNRSGKASKLLNHLGFKAIYDLKGGMIAWKRQ